MTLVRKLAFAALFAVTALGTFVAVTAPVSAGERAEPYWKR